MVDESQRQRQTPHTSNALDNYYGWDSSTGRDVRNQPSLPIQYQYRDQGRTVVSDREPRWTDFGANRVNTQLKRPKSFTNMDMFNRPDLGFRYSHMEPGRKSHDLFDIPGDPSQDASIRGTWRRKETAPRTADEYGYLEGAPRQRTTFSEGYMNPRSFDEMYGGVYDDAIFRTVDPNTNQIEQFPMAEGIEQAAVDPSDYRTIMKIIEQGLNPEDYMASTGIMGALPEERQIAELSKPQLDFMKSPMGTPDFYSNYQDYKDAVDAREEKPLFGIFGGQEPATDPEIINKLKETYGTIPFQVPEIV